ncbi:DUF6338 family protein [Cellulomonas soli]|uniref:Uncharacterized protein n=1 Tax=Cellulomonas soli TaxID=931535 RepID=A0A512P9F5_9CELL|nr:DUF6338 family protein [Cellulomonas soli]NYI60326.1 hypothetical protein [Cellulomonas soli]GEP67838.1 hypothetical protein CSO01_05530 [Cellulomonas soli]
MITENWLGILLFFLFAAPGLLYDLREDRYRATVKESAFREAGRTALASVLLASAALPFTYLASLLLPAVFASPAEALRAGAGAVRVDPARLGATVAVQVGVALALAWLVQWLRRRSSETNIVADSLWTLSLRDQKTPDSRVLVRARLKSGEIWSGLVEGFSADLEVADRELVLGPPLSRISNRKSQEMPQEWVRVVITGTEIEYLMVQYVTLDEG